MRAGSGPVRPPAPGIGAGSRRGRGGGGLRAGEAVCSGSGESVCGRGRPPDPSTGRPGGSCVAGIVRRLRPRPGPEVRVRVASASLGAWSDGNDRAQERPSAPVPVGSGKAVCGRDRPPEPEHGQAGRTVRGGDRPPAAARPGPEVRARPASGPGQTGTTARKRNRPPDTTPAVSSPPRSVTRWDRLPMPLPEGPPQPFRCPDRFAGRVGSRSGPPDAVVDDLESDSLVRAPAWRSRRSPPGCAGARS